MKVKSVIINDIFKRHKYRQKELKLRVVKILSRLKVTNFYNLLNNLSKVDLSHFFCRINNLCFITSRNKSINKKVRLSRIKFKEFINNGLLLGFAKYSW